MNIYSYFNYFDRSFDLLMMSEQPDQQEYAVHAGSMCNIWS